MATQQLPEQVTVTQLQGVANFLAGKIAAACGTECAKRNLRTACESNGISMDCFERFQDEVTNAPQ